jgi:sugar phosphate isomerase/epimerase
MRLGGFGKIADYTKISKAGYDFAELDMPEIEALSEHEFEAFQNTMEELKFPILTGARILPVATPLFFTDGFVPTELEPYLTRTCRRARVLGIKKVILGNGKARSLLTDGDRNKTQIFIDTLRIMAEVAGANDQELLLEPLGPKYSNYINTIPEAVRIIEKVNMPNIFTMADMRHMIWSEESFENLADNVHYIHHVHIDYPTSYPEREYPSAKDGYDYSVFLRMLKKSGYNDTLAIEADIPADWNAAYRQAMEVLGDIL